MEKRELFSQVLWITFVGEHPIHIIRIVVEIVIWEGTYTIHTLIQMKERDSFVDGTMKRVFNLLIAIN